MASDEKSTARTIIMLVGTSIVAIVVGGLILEWVKAGSKSTDTTSQEVTLSKGTATAKNPTSTGSDNVSVDSNLSRQLAGSWDSSGSEEDNWTQQRFLQNGKLLRFKRIGSGQDQIGGIRITLPTYSITKGDWWLEGQKIHMKIERTSAGFDIIKLTTEQLIVKDATETHLWRRNTSNPLTLDEEGHLIPARQ